MTTPIEQSQPSNADLAPTTPEQRTRSTYAALSLARGRAHATAIAD